MKLKLYTDDYLMAMGAVGLKRLVNANEEKQWVNRDITDHGLKFEQDHIAVSKDLLTVLPELYFHYLLDYYSVAKRDERRLQVVGNPRVSLENQLNQLKTTVKDGTDKVKKYFADRSEFAELKQCYEEVKKLKAKDAAGQLETYKDKYLSLMKTKDIDEKLTLNFVKSVVLQHMYGQPSFLNVSKSSLTLAEQIEMMRQDYVEPVLLDMEIKNLLETKPWTEFEKKRLLDLLNTAPSNTTYKNWNRKIKKMAAEKIPDYFDQQLRCIFFEEYLAAYNYEEMIFSPLGVSANKAFNFSWNLGSKQSVPLSSWARLVFFLIPIGVVPYTRYMSSDSKQNKDRYETFYTFVYCNGTPEMIFNDNERLRNLEQNESFDRLIPKLLERERYKARQHAKSDLLFIEFNSNYESKKTIMNYYHIPPHVVRYFDTDGLQKIHFISDRSLRDTFIRLIMESIDPAPEIWKHLRIVIREGISVHSVWSAWQERLKLENLKRGRDPMDNSKSIHYLYFEGKKVRDKLIRVSVQRGESAGYASGGDKRATGIAYRLLNAAKAGNKKQFLDTVIRLYLQVDLPIPQSFLNVLHEKKLDFPSVAGAFITGLLSGDKSDGDSDKQNSEELTTTIE